jgi:hypothetical protein
MKAEAPKVAEHRRKGRCDCYLLFTNRKLTAPREEKLVAKLRQETGVPNVAILGKETLTTYLDDAPQIAEVLNLQVAPFVAGLPTIAPPTRDFAGRTDELEELRRQVREHGGAVIHGVRGWSTSTTSMPAPPPASSPAPTPAAGGARPPTASPATRPATSTSSSTSTPAPPPPTPPTARSWHRPAAR